VPQLEQPMSLVVAPPVYPGHDYAGEGEIVRVRVGRTPVGWLSRKTPDDVGWLPADAPSRPDRAELAAIVRGQVQDALREGAAAGTPLVEVWAALLDQVQHDAPVRADLGQLRG
jgi:hypothetical protein